MTEAILRILGKLAEVRRRELACFGSETHGFRLNPPLSEAEVATFEEEQGIRLPEDYRQFLTQAGNGGAGPYFGLLPLEKWDDAVLEEAPDYLARPSPLRPDQPEDTPWEEALGCTWEELFQGTLALVHQGCAYYALLVVSGVYRGRVVYVSLDCGGTPYFVHHADFLSWYKRWLDELLWGYEGQWFGFGLPGREAELVAVLGAPESSAELREEALSTLSRIPKLEPESLAAVQAALHDADASVRERALQLLGKHSVSAAIPMVTELVSDAVPGVRSAALATLAKLPGAAWEAAARRALADGDGDVVFRALCLLKDARLLRRADLEPLFRSRAASTRRNAVWAAEAVADGAASEVIPTVLFNDPDPQVRSMAIRAAKTPADRPKLPVLLASLRRETDPEVLCALVDSLGNLGNRDAAVALIEMTKHADAFVRQYAARALGKLRDRRAVSALEALLSDDTTPARRDEAGRVHTTSAYTVADVARAALRDVEGC